ncbi:nucleotide exchange factor SIL1-like [Argiope bruennichi]|uniref:Nucleotide exchange factor SIL1 n=1 Tax=Argiope bruennichi TaxID=94029 RepID=A0A8T0F3J6_ARGBR|nr:nucleotide exchange factor SIL1-like [Argiope bruennichi]KAF8785754.1 Nucleotide exchange factor SIL1 like protein [Argiope bruennichi]
MELSLLLLAVTGLLITDKAKNSEGQLIPIHPVEDEPDLVNDETVDKKHTSFTSQELKDIHDLAKNISHSKGHITQSEEGDPEYRRSYMRKVIRETKFESLKFWFTKHSNSSGEYSVSDLQDLEHLVHQYDTAIDFIKLGGLEFLLPLISHTDPEISSATFSVLTAAMQGNPTVQKYAEDAQILNYILKVLRNAHRRSTSSLYTLSSYIRNNPVSQLNFFRHKGLNILAGILKSQVDNLKSKLKVLELLSDLASEIYMGPVTAYENQNQLAKLKRAFASGFSNLNLCEIIPKYLDYDDFVILEKTIFAMNSVAPNVCSKDFKKPHVIKVVGQLLLKYEPKKKFWLTKHESELRWIIWTELQALYDVIKM